MKVLLINPHYPGWIVNKEFILPLNLLYLAGALKAAGHSPEILDLNVYKPWLKGDDSVSSLYCQSLIENKIADSKPGLIGIGCMFSGSFPVVLEYTQKIRKRFPGIPIVIGGIHPTLYSTQILQNCGSIDYVVLGEGEESLAQLVKALENGESFNPAGIEKIEGITYRQSGNVMTTKRTHFIKDLDGIPFPAYELVDIKDYYHDTSGWFNPRNMPINATIPILSSRSCPNLCNFCVAVNIMGRGWRYRSVHNIVDEIEYFYNTHNHRHFSFIDDNFTFKKSRVLEICNEINKRNLKLQFETPNVATATIDDEVMEAMVGAGLTRIGLAIESGSDFIRNKVMGKHLSRDSIINAVRITKKYKDKIYVKAFFIIGMPEETMETLMETYEMIKEIDVDEPYVNNIMPFPGTLLFEQALKDGLFLNNIDLDNIWKMEAFHVVGNKNFYLKPYNMTMEELSDFRKKVDDLLDVMVKKKLESRGMFHHTYRVKEQAPSTTENG